MQTRIRIFVLCLAGFVFLPAVASASTYCVHKAVSGCTHAEQTVQNALDAAANHPGPDIVKIAAGTFTGTPSNCANYGEAYYYSESAPNSVTITGAGVGKTVLTCAIGGSNAVVVFLEGAAEVSGLSVHVPGGEAMYGVEVEDGARTNGIEVDGVSDSSGDTGVFGRSGIVENTVVKLPTNQTNTGIELTDGGTADRVTVSAGEAAVSAYGGARITRARLTSGVGVWAQKGRTTVYDSLIKVITGQDGYNSGLLAQDNGIGDTGAHVTVVGGSLTIVSDIAGPTGVYSNAVQAGQVANVTLTDSIIHGPLTALARAATTGATANVTTSYDDYPSGSYLGTGTGVTTQSGPALAAAPYFVKPSAGNYALRASSPLVDAGTPGGLAAGEPKRDLAGRPRILAGKGTCTARRDIGAYEFVPAKLPAQATASKSQVRAGHSLSFHATGCSIDPALIVKFRWKFDDGTTATGATVSHAFQHAGKHHASVTVFDRAGRRGTATVTVTVLAH